MAPLPKVLASALVSFGSASLARAEGQSGQCQGILQKLEAKSDFELRALCRAEFSPGACGETLRSLGARPWGKEQLEATCKSWVDSAPSGEVARVLDQAQSVDDLSAKETTTTAMPGGARHSGRDVDTTVVDKTTTTLSGARQYEERDKEYAKRGEKQSLLGKMLEQVKKLAPPKPVELGKMKPPPMPEALPVPKLPPMPKALEIKPPPPPPTLAPLPPMPKPQAPAPLAGSDGKHPPSSGSDGQHPPSSGSDGQHAPRSGSDGQHPPSSGSDGQHPPSSGSDGQHRVRSGSGGPHAPRSGSDGQHSHARSDSDGVADGNTEQATQEKFELSTAAAPTPRMGVVTAGICGMAVAAMAALGATLAARRLRRQRGSTVPDEADDLMATLEKQPEGAE